MSVPKKLSVALILFILGIAGLVISFILAVYFAPLFSLELFLVVCGFLTSFVTAKLSVDWRNKLVALRAEGFEFQKEVGDATNLYWIYYNLLKDILTSVHGNKLKLSDSREFGVLNDRVTHLKNCPDCQKLLRYVANEMQKLLPVEMEKEVEA